MRKIAVLFLLVTGFSTVALAGTKHMPLAQSVLQAKHIYIDNETPDCPQCGNQVYSEVLKWGRFQVVSDPKDADLIFVLKSTSTKRIVGTGGNITSLEDYTVYLTVLDAHTNQNLYSDGEYWRFRWSKPSITLVKDFRKRIETQEHESKH